jgi:hypothetical protein
VIWDFSAVSGKINHFYLNYLALTLTFPAEMEDLMAEHQDIEYDDTLVTMLEMIWGEGFLKKRCLQMLSEHFDRVGYS